MDTEKDGSFWHGQDAETLHKAALTSPAAAASVLDAFFCSSLAGLAILDDQLRYVRVNHILADLNGAPVADHLGRTVAEVLPELAPSIEPILRGVLQSGRPIFNHQIVGITPREPGVLHSWLCSFVPILEDHGRPVGLGGIVVEINHRNAVELPRALHSEDFRSVNWFGTEYLFSPKQAACIKILWAARDNTTPYVADGTVLTRAGVGNKQRLRDVFKHHPAWHEMIMQGPQRDTHYLKDPTDNKHLASTSPTASPT